MKPPRLDAGLRTRLRFVRSKAPVMISGIANAELARTVIGVGQFSNDFRFCLGDSAVKGIDCLAGVERDVDGSDFIAGLRRFFVLDASEHEQVSRNFELRVIDSIAFAGVYHVLGAAEHGFEPVDGSASVVVAQGRIDGLLAG
jgi:hypothetical protein